MPHTGTADTQHVGRDAAVGELRRNWARDFRAKESEGTNWPRTRRKHQLSPVGQFLRVKWGWEKGDWVSFSCLRQGETESRNKENPADAAGTNSSERSVKLCLIGSRDVEPQHAHRRV